MKVVAAGRKFWKVAELAEYLAVPRGWVYDRTQSNGPDRIPHIKLGKYIRFDPESEAFRQWLAEHEVRSEN
jgi:excisionase family DNA binding protein